MKLKFDHFSPTTLLEQILNFILHGKTDKETY